MTTLHHTATSESMKPLMSHNDSGVSSFQPDDTNYMETSMTSTPMKGDPIKLYIDDTQSSSSDSSDSGNSSGNSLAESFTLFHSKVEGFLADHSCVMKKISLVVMALGYLCYFVYALYLHGSRKNDINIWPLVVITSLAIISIIVWRFGGDVKKHVKNTFGGCHKAFMNKWFIFKWVAIFVIYGGMLAIIVVTVWDVPSNLVSLAGIITFIIILFICSAHPTQVKWQPVLGGFTLQFYFAVLILRWEIGFKAFHYLGQKIQVFLAYTDVGSEFVFGNKYVDHIFAMKVLPVVIFFSCVISVLYYLGIMMAIIGGIAWVMKKMLGTTAAESLCAAGNIFVGQTEAPILIRPYLTHMTKSELHAVMVGGFATIAGGVMAAYVSFGVPAEHLLCATVMNAPCALAVSKLLFPEVEHSKVKNITEIDIDDTENKPRNILEAAASGASQSISLVANIAANLIAFLALLAFVNGALSWFGSYVLYPELSFEKICSYVFKPISYMMGVDWVDAGVVGELVGIKTFLNEFVAYRELSVYITNRKECAMDQPIISQRSEIIATYALCGFSNLSSIGIQLGGLGPMAPKRVAELTQLVVRALFGGIIACLLTASVAGLLMEDHTSAMMSCILKDNATSTLNSTMLNSTLLNSTVLNTTLAYS